MDRIRELLGRQVDASSLGLFRILWGILMVWESIRKLPKVSGMYSPEYFHFTYPMFPFMKPFPEVWMMYTEVWIMITAAVLITLGLFFRYASAVFLFGYTHLFLIEKLYYNNHFYLTILIAFLMMVSCADVCYSIPWLLKRRQGIKANPTLPIWNLILLRGQVVVLYFFGGIAKLNSDWLQGEPVRYWFAHKGPDHVFSPFIGEEWFVWMVCWTGLILDLTVGFFLLNRKFRLPAILVLITFHTMNHFIFNIGLFPYIGISLCLLFIDPDRPRIVFSWLAKHWFGWKETILEKKPKAILNKKVAKPLPVHWSVAVFVCAYLAVQILWPLRTWFYRDNPSWTEVGHTFSWRMMLRHKDGFLQFVFDPPEAERYLEQHPEILPKVGKAHVQRMVKNPHFILQYAHALSDSLEKNGVHDVKIRCISVVSLNGRPYQVMIDPKTDLATASYGLLEVPDWILPLDKYRRAGQYPQNTKERQLAIRQAIRDYAKTQRAVQQVPVRQVIHSEDDSKRVKFRKNNNVPQ